MWKDTRGIVQASKYFSLTLPIMAAVPNASSSTPRLITFTTPKNYAPRLRHVINLRGWTPLWCPTIVVEPTPQTISSILRHLSAPLLPALSAVAFTSRTGISAFSEALTHLAAPPPLSPDGETFTISALGKDAELLNESFIAKLCDNPGRIRILVPRVPTPTGLVEALGLGLGRKVLCPVPLVLGLDEPPVVPNFLSDLDKKGWAVIRVDGYETRWAGPRCGEEFVRRIGEREGMDAIVFTSSGEVEGLLKSLKELGLDWEMVRKRCPRMLVAAHGPVTAAGAQRLGVGVDVVSAKFDSFDGVVDALAYRWNIHY